MGLSNSSAKPTYNFDNVWSGQEFAQIINNEQSKAKLHNQMVRTDKYPKIFICEKETEEDRADPVYRENCEIDDICANYHNQFYVGKLKTVRVDSPDSVGDIIWMDQVYHKYWAYGLDIYEYDRSKPEYKKLVVSEYYLGSVDKRKDYHMANDLIEICSITNGLTRDAIETQIITQLENTRIKNQTRMLINECERRNIQIY